MVLSAALDSGYVFVVLIAILTSVISAVYYLNIIKEVFFYKTDYKFNSNMHHSSFNSIPSFKAARHFFFSASKKNLLRKAPVGEKNCLELPLASQPREVGNKIFFVRKNKPNIILSSYLTITISILTLLILLFICFSVNLLDLVNILSLSFL